MIGFTVHKKQPYFKYKFKNACLITMAFNKYLALTVLQQI